MKIFREWVAGVGLIVALGCCALFPGKRLGAAQPIRRHAVQMFTTGYNLPNVTIQLTDGQGVPLFASVDNVQVTAERPAGGVPINVPVVAIDSLDPALYFLTVNVSDFHGPSAWVLGDPTPPINIAPPGTKVWIVVEGIGR